MRKFWITTGITVTTAIVLTIVVAGVAGLRAGKIFAIAAVLGTSLVALSDSVATVRRNRRSRG